MSTACRLHFVVVLICKFASDAADTNNIIDILCLLYPKAAVAADVVIHQHTKSVQPVVWLSGEAK
jgi:hypothetical protein